MTSADDPNFIIESRLRAIVRINFERASQSSIKRSCEIRDRMRTSSVWVTQARDATIDEIKAAITNCTLEAERDVSIQLRDPPQAFWDQLRLYIRETLFRSLNSIQQTIKSSSGTNFALSAFDRSFRDINFPIENFINNAIGEKIQQDQLRLLVEKPKGEATSSPQAITAPDKAQERFDYVDSSRIEELRSLRDFDPKRLIQLCEELNSSFKGGGLFGPAMLVRAIVDHVPPIFGLKTFHEVSSQHPGGGRSFKDSMSHLDNSLRKIADSYLHLQIRKQESLPTVTQIDFSNDLDVLLGEIVRIGCSEKRESAIKTGEL